MLNDSDAENRKMHVVNERNGADVLWFAFIASENWLEKVVVCCGNGAWGGNGNDDDCKQNKTTTNHHHHNNRVDA